MRKRNRRYSLSTVLWALLLVPPLGLFLLWTAPWTRRVKINLTVATLVLFAVLAGIAWRTGYYQNFIEPPVPASGFDVDRDNQGHYRIDRVLPFERQIFLEVVTEKRRMEKETGGSFSQTVGRMIDDPETRAMEIVAERHGLDSTDVMAIFMKVSSKMAPRH